MSLMT